MMKVTLMFLSFECAVRQTFLTCFLLNARDWELLPGTFMILLKQQYSKILQLLIVGIYHFKQVTIFKMAWTLAPVLQLVQNIRENYCNA